MLLDGLPAIAPAQRAVHRRVEAPVNADPARSADQTAAVRAEASAALQQARGEANRALAQKGRELSFEFDRELGRVIVKLVDTKTREVIRQVPSEEMQAIARALAAGEDAGVLLRGLV
jgi:flagellar protein FlaG